MIRSRLALFLFVALAACGGKDESAGTRAVLADLGANPQAQETPHAQARYVPPPGSWRVRSESLRPEEWYEEYASEDGDVLMRVNVFPIRASRAPAAVLGLAVDTFLRGLGTEGFGAAQHRFIEIIGAPAAEVAWSAVVGLERVKGGARLLRTSDDRWAFAIGYTHAERDERLPIVQAFVKSLEPVEPVFYPRRFRTPSDFDLVVVHKPGEAPVTQRDLLAVELVLEAGTGVRFPLSTRVIVRAVLREDVATAKEKRTRDAYRETGAAMTKAADLPVEERIQGMRALGSRSLKALVERANEGYKPAVRFAGLLKRLREMTVGQAQDGLNVGSVRCLHEQCAFLASLATNREVRADPERGDRIAKALGARWAQLDPAERQALAESGVAWARLRRAWDMAPEAARTATRQRLARALATPEQAAALADEGDLRALLTWMDALPAEALDGFVLRAAALTTAQRADLLSALDLEAATGWDLGW